VFCRRRALQRRGLGSRAPGALDVDRRAGDHRVAGFDRSRSAALARRHRRRRLSVLAALTRLGRPYMSSVRSAADPATFEIVKNALYKIAEEMRVVLVKTAYSPILKSAGDFSCGVFDAAGQMVAQGHDLPIHLGSMPDAVRAVAAAYEHDVHDGDVFIHNDPYCGGGHPPDVHLLRPSLFPGGAIVRACFPA